MKDYQLIIRQGIDANPNLGEQIIQPLVDQALESQDSYTLSLIQQALKEYNSKAFQPDRVLQEAQTLEKSIESMSFSYNTGNQNSTGQILTLSLHVSQSLTILQKQSLEEWIRMRIGQPDSVIQWKEITK